MSPKLAVEFEPILRARIADVRQFVDRVRHVTVAAAALRSYRAIAGVGAPSFLLANLVYPDDLITALRDPASEPSVACAAAALAPLVARCLPTLSGRLADALREAMDSSIELHLIVSGRPHVFRLRELCGEIEGRTTAT